MTPMMNKYLILKRKPDDDHFFYALFTDSQFAAKTALESGQIVLKLDALTELQSISASFTEFEKS